MTFDWMYKENPYSIQEIIHISCFLLFVGFIHLFNENSYWAFSVELSLVL